MTSQEIHLSADPEPQDHEIEFDAYDPSQYIHAETRMWIASWDVPGLDYYRPAVGEDI